MTSLSRFFLLLGLFLAGLTSIRAQTTTPPSNGLQAWYKADSLTGLTNGAPVSSWLDSTSTYSLAQANLNNQTGSRRPLVASELPVRLAQELTLDLVFKVMCRKSWFMTTN
jgi:hypothetical protein